MERPVTYKHSSLFDPSVSYEEDEFYNIVPCMDCRQSEKNVFRVTHSLISFDQDFVSYDDKSKKDNLCLAGIAWRVRFRETISTVVKLLPSLTSISSPMLYVIKRFTVVINNVR